MKLKIGDTIWLFDRERRVYAQDSSGRSFGAPIWREHWGPYVITGETRVSWVVRGDTKIPKRGGRYIAFSEEEVDQRCWVDENAYRLGLTVGMLKDYALLRQIAELVGMA